jgi:hypothetical protein
LQRGKSGKPAPVTRDELDEWVRADAERIERLKKKEALNGGG